MMANELALRDINHDNDDGYIDHLRLQRNDPGLTYFVISSGEYGDEVGFVPHEDDWARTGECLGRNEHLERLCLSIDTLEEEEIEKFNSLCRGLSLNTSIKTLEINGDLCDGMGYIFLTPFLEKNGIECLKIEHDDGTNDSVSSRQLASALMKFTSLTTFSFEMGCVEDKVFQEVMKGLRWHSSLSKLELWGPNLSEYEKHSFSSLATLLQNPDSSLNELSINGSDGIDDEAAVVLAVALATNSTLKKLILCCGRNMTTTGIMALCHLLQSPQIRLECLSLHGVASINTRATSSIPNALNNNTHLVSLCLDKNIGMNVAFWQALPAYLEKCRLQYLSLRSSLLFDQIAIPIINSLAENNTLTGLDLSHNPDISNVGWHVLSSFLEDPRCLLERVNLHDNSLNDESASVIARSLSGNHRLKELTLYTPHEASINTRTGLSVLAQVLYRKMNVMETYLSNHTLESHSWLDENFPDDLSISLQINQEYNDRDAARQKIIKCFFNGDYSMPLSDMGSNVLPNLMAWLGRPVDGEERNDVDVCRLSLMYQIVRVTPTLFSFMSKGKKRKSCDC